MKEKGFEKFGVATVGRLDWTSTDGGGQCPSVHGRKAAARSVVLWLPWLGQGVRPWNQEIQPWGSGSGGCVLWEPLALPKVQGQGQGEARFGKMQGAGNEQ
jgi:hypothetical protein